MAISPTIKNFISYATMLEGVFAGNYAGNCLSVPPPPPPLEIRNA